MAVEHTPHPRIAERAAAGPHTTKAEQASLNGKIAIVITNMVGTMWCAYAFAALALISLPAAIQGGIATLIGWIAQTFLQLVLLSVIMVGQKVSAAASDKQALQTYKDAEALLKIQDDVHRLIKLNNDLTAQIHAATCTGGWAPPKASAPAKAAPAKKAPAAKKPAPKRKA
jgi:hypothetical protein